MGMDESAVNESKQPEGIRVPLRFMLPQGTPVPLVDGLIVQTNDGLVTISLFRKEHPVRLEGAEEDQEITEVVSYCQGRFAMTKEAYSELVQVLNEHHSRIFGNKLVVGGK
jgi:hypothetical protein